MYHVGIDVSKAKLDIWRLLTKCLQRREQADRKDAGFPV
ncbi:Uncharacterised protein [Yersinia similis]|nr:Uncharacterised protein [Yersinia similis]